MGAISKCAALIPGTARWLSAASFWIIRNIRVTDRVIVGKDNKARFERMFNAPGAALNDRLHRNPRKADIIEVTEKYTLKDGKREIGMYSIDTQHSTGTLIAYIPDAKLAFVTDLWSPGRDPLPAKPTQNLIDLVKGVKHHGLNPERRRRPRHDRRLRAARQAGWRLIPN